MERGQKIFAWYVFLLIAISMLIATGCSFTNKPREIFTLQNKTSISDYDRGRQEMLDVLISELRLVESRTDDKFAFQYIHSKLKYWEARKREMLHK